MKMLRVVWLSTAMLVAVPVAAHDCSGGADGGMDATGTQCNPGFAAAGPEPRAPEIAPSATTTPRADRAAVPARKVVASARPRRAKR